MLRLFKKMREEDMSLFIQVYILVKVSRWEMKVKEIYVVFQ